MCGILEGSEVNLILSSCGREEFTCQDGCCIPLISRCDLRLDCPDDSDETGCSVVILPKGYNSDIPPPSEKVGEPLPIYFTINILTFPNIKTQELIFEAAFQLKLKWRDLRLNFKNLKNDQTLNELELKNVTWSPSIFFKNAFGNMFTNLDKGSKIHCIPEADSIPGTLDLEEESK